MRNPTRSRGIQRRMETGIRGRECCGSRRTEVVRSCGSRGSGFYLAGEPVQNQSSEVNFPAGVVDVYANQVSAAVVVEHNALRDLAALGNRAFESALLRSILIVLQRVALEFSDEIAYLLRRAGSRFEQGLQQRFEMYP